MSINLYAVHQKTNKLANEMKTISSIFVKSDNNNGKTTREQTK